MKIFGIVIAIIESQKQNIKKKFGNSLEWEILEDKRASRVAIYRQGSINEDTTTLIEIKDWCIRQLQMFKKVFEKRLETAVNQQ